MASDSDDRRPPGRNPFAAEAATDPTEVEITTPMNLRRSLVLRQVTGPGAPRAHRCVTKESVVGRSHRGEIVIDAPDLSRRHALLERQGEEIRCTDLQSRHGVFLNGLRVHSCVLRPGDHLRLGSISFILEFE